MDHEHEHSSLGPGIRGRPRGPGLGALCTIPPRRTASQHADFTFDRETDCYVLGNAKGGGAIDLPNAFNPRNLRRRCAALQDVIDQPAVHISRMARWLARAAEKRKHRPGRRHPLGVGAPPGASREQKQKDPEHQTLLYYLDELAQAAVARQRSP